MAERARKKGIHWSEWARLCKLKEDGGLGFRCFEKFNIALLAKQGWRLLTRLDSLLTRVIKANYFPNSKFLNSQLGNQPFYSWKSIWATKRALQASLGWRVGSGRDIYINSHASTISSLNYRICDSI